jgi:polar amino acid transport system substrate-binding protein
MGLAGLLLLVLLAVSGGPAASDTASLADPASAGSAASGVQRMTLRGGWMPSAPYQMDAPGSVGGLAGIDIEITREVARRAGLGVQIDLETWETQLARLLTGESDIASGGVLAAGEESRFLASVPYRQMRTAFFTREGDHDRQALSDVPALLENDPTFRLGILAGRRFGQPALDGAIEGLARDGRIVPAQSEEENVANLAEGRIDGFLADRLGAAAAALAAGQKFSAQETVLPGTTPVRFLFSRQTVDPEIVQKVDAALAEMESDGTIKQIIHGYMIATVIGYAFDSLLFRSLDIIGTVAFAISGVLIAVRERYSLVGAMVLSALPAVGGGALRDLLVDRHPLGVLSTPLYLCLVGGTVLAGLGIIRLAGLARKHGWRIARHRLASNPAMFRNLHEFSDAIGMSVFTVSGVAVAITMDATPLWLWGPILAMLTAAGGGILRDIVRQSGSVSSLKDEFYAEVPLIWGFLLSVFLLTRPTQLVPEQVGLAIICTVIGAFVTRIVVVVFGLRSPPFGWRRD